MQIIECSERQGNIDRVITNTYSTQVLQFSEYNNLLYQMKIFEMLLSVFQNIYARYQFLGQMYSHKLINRLLVHSY